MGGIPVSGGAYLCSNISQVASILVEYNSANKLDSIIDVYTVPTNFTNGTVPDTLLMASMNQPRSYTKTFSKPNSIDGYIPNNKKLLTSPYCFLKISNNNGVSNAYHYEEFYDTETFPRIMCICCERCSCYRMLDKNGSVKL